MKRRFKQTGSWIWGRLELIPARDNAVTMWLVLALWLASSVSVVISAIGNPLGASAVSHILNIGRFFGGNLLLFIIVVFLVSALLSFIYLPVPRLLVASFAYSATISVLVLSLESSGTAFSLVVGIGYTLVVLLLSLFFIILYHPRFKRAVKIGALTLVMVILLSLIYVQKTQTEEVVLPIESPNLEQIDAVDPGEPGDYPYQFLTYGSGTDKQRAEFGSDVDIETSSVDASHFVSNWNEKREKFWGFNSDDLPINGRVFMPEGAGPFPVFLMVHGNHTMEDFSTPGYDYVGELLASQGIMAISVDEDFVNYSNRLGIPKDNYSLRAWMLIQHLAKLQEMNTDSAHPFYGKLDLENVGLMGHSRGGQAVAMAADFESFFDEEIELSEMLNSVQIKAVVAVSPTDKKTRDRFAELHNTSYLLLHGANDADVSSFKGDQQFYRTTFDSDFDGLKASVYVEGANHAQFNSEWGRRDLSMPRGLFLSVTDLIKPEEQQKIAKVYIASFLNQVFNKDKTYEPLFEDSRHGEKWLPETYIVNKFEAASYQSLVQYSGSDTSLLETNGFESAEIVRPRGRRGQKHQVDTLQIEWQGEAEYSTPLAFAELRDRRGSMSDRLVIRVANINEDADKGSRPEIDLELVTKSGESERLSLADLGGVPPVIYTTYTPYGLGEDLFREGKYDVAWEPVFQTIEVPLSSFKSIDLNELETLTLYFVADDGKVLLEEIGTW